MTAIPCARAVSRLATTSFWERRVTIAGCTSEEAWPADNKVCFTSCVRCTSFVWDHLQKFGCEARHHGKDRFRGQGHRRLRNGALQLLHRFRRPTETLVPVR